MSCLLLHLLVHLPATFIALLRHIPGHGKECSRKLNHRAHQWRMRTGEDAHERANELKRFCELVCEDRKERDESAEYERLHELNGDDGARSEDGDTALAELTGGMVIGGSFF